MNLPTKVKPVDQIANQGSDQHDAVFDSPVQETPAIENQPDEQTIKVAFAKLRIPVTSNRPEHYEGNRLTLKLTRSNNATLYGVLYALQATGEKMADGSIPRLPIDAFRWMLDKIGAQFEQVAKVPEE